MTSPYPLGCLPPQWETSWSAHQVLAVILPLFLSDNEAFAHIPGVLSISNSLTLPSDAISLSMYLFDVAEIELTPRRPSKKFWHNLSFVCEVLVRWFFPPSYKHRRSNTGLEVLLAATLVVNGLLWVRGHS